MVLYIVSRAPMASRMSISPQSGQVVGFVVVAEKPEGGPDAFAGGELDAGFEASVFLREVILRVDAGGGVVAGYSVGADQVFFAGGDDEVAVALLDIGGAGGVGF